MSKETTGEQWQLQGAFIKAKTMAMTRKCSSEINDKLKTEISDEENVMAMDV